MIGMAGRSILACVIRTWSAVNLLTLGYNDFGTIGLHAGLIAESLKDLIRKNDDKFKSKQKPCGLR